MKRILLALCILPALMILAACTPMEEKRDALMQSARTLAASGQCAEASKAAQEALDLDPSLSEALLLLGRCELDAGRRAAAAAHYSRALELMPNSIETLMALSRIALLENDADKADGYAQKARSLGADTGELTVLRAGVLVEKGDYAAAKPLLEEVLAANPDDEEALIGLASAYLNTDERDKAKALLQKSLDRHGKSPAVLSLLMNIGRQEKDWALTENCLRRLIDLTPKSEELTLQLVDVLALGGKTEEVPGLLTSFLEKNPTASRARMGLIAIESSQGHFDKALELINQAPEQNPALKFTKANLLATAGRIDECIALIKEIIHDPQSSKSQVAEARMGLAEIHMQREAPEEALKELDALIQADPENANALILRGRIRLGMRNLPGAIADFEAILTKTPGNAVAALALADAHFSSGNTALAENMVTGVIQRNPKFAQAYMTLANLYLAQQMPDAALMTLRLGKVAAPDDTNIPFAEADLLTNLKRYGDAIKVLEGLAGKKELAEAALFRMAAVHGQAKQHKQAVSAYERILKANPDSRMAAEGQLRAQVAAKQEKAALEFAEKRLKQRPKDPSAAMMVGEAAMANKNLAKAEKAYLQAIELAPQWEQPLLKLVQIYAGTKRLDQAIKLCRDTMAKAPDAAQPAMVLAMLHEQKGDLRSAEDVYRNILIKHPEMLPAANNLAFLITRNKPTPERLAEAEELAKKATASGSASTLDTLGWIQHLRGNNAEAEKNLRAAVEDNGDNPFMTYHLAVVLAAQKDKAKNKEARELLQDVLAKNKNFPLKADADKLLKKLAAAK